MTEDRFRLSRAGIVNVWQYDDQVFDFGDGRLLLRGTNGAGKSKTLEMLLPFVIDGDKSRITASGKHHTSLIWLMLDGYEGQSRTGYLWVEFRRSTADGEDETVTCGIGLRASESARTATTWFFTTPRRVGEDFELTDTSGPLTMQQLRAALEPDGSFFEPNQLRRYREHVGQVLFGLPLDQYEDLLRLLYWLRQPQVGEDIDPKRLAEQLVQALPSIDESAIRTAGDTFDQLEEFGEQIDRQQRAAVAIATFLETYAAHARSVVEERARAVVTAQEVDRRNRREVKRLERALAETEQELGEARLAHEEARRAGEDASARISQLEAGPEARAQQQLLALGSHLRTRRQHAEQAMRREEEHRRRVEHEVGSAARRGEALQSAVHGWASDAQKGRELAGVSGITGALGATSQVAVTELDWADDEPVRSLRAEVARFADERSDLIERVGVARAAAQVVENARVEAERQRAEAHRRDEESATREAALERRTAQLDRAILASTEAAESFLARLESWRESADGVPFDLPALDEEGLAALEGIVAQAAGPVRSELEEARAVARAALRDAEETGRSLRQERDAVAAQTDPTPPGPRWHRSGREGRPGDPFWRLVDFREDAGLEPAARASLEAALEGSGLLDAWVTPDGRLLTGSVDDDRSGDRVDASGESDDVHDLFVDVSGAGGPADGRVLAELLRPDVPEDGTVGATVVARVLAAVRMTEDVREGAAGATFAIGRDGSWRSGPLAGRTGKAAAQYIGATARAAERARRLAELDEQIAVTEARAAEHRATAERAGRRLHALVVWQGSRPHHRAVLAAWSEEQATLRMVEEAQAELAEARLAAQRARSVAAAAHQRLVALAEQHGLPPTAEGLAARLAALADVTAAVERLDAGHRAVLRDLDEWEAQAERVRQEQEGLHRAAAEASEARTEAERAAAELEELREAAGASVKELEERLATLAEQRDRSRAQAEELTGTIEGHVARQARTSGELDVARERMAAAGPALEEARAALLALERSAGVVDAALGIGSVAGASGPAEAGSAAYVPWTPEDPAALIERIPAGKRADENALVAAHQVLIASAAASHEPRISKVDGVWIAVGMGEQGERPLVELEAQLSARVRENKELLSQRERQIFEEHVLGHLGDSLRAVRLKAKELVDAMNGQLGGVTTSQGIAVRLRWRLRDDIPADAKRAVELLGTPVSAMLADERAELRESLHRLIDASRADAPEEPYAEHLTRALDYRRWFGFSVQYRRPEVGEWRDLQRKSALSQGEQKVLCYLPLFAAAAAHFTSLAGAAPHAPRFVLLDDAFPKIDARTHPLLFGLLVDLDLDFVVTSERLWGTHATVPRLAIYEALRSPGERGIAQFEHRWDGHQLTAVGAGG